jgi:ribosome-associated protein
VRTVEFQLRGEFIELCQLLKGAGLAESGGRGKLLVAAGQVRVDGKPESRKTAKIRAGQTVECLGTTVTVCGPRRPDAPAPG